MYPAAFEYLSPTTLDVALSAEHAGVRYYFCCAGCCRRFESSPDHYIEVSAQ